MKTTAITTADHPPKFWERPVDGVFSKVRKAYLQELLAVDGVFSKVRKAYLQELLDHINNLHPRTQFTKEEENSSTLRFLETLVQRN